jgi:hypothetical protein
VLLVIDEIQSNHEVSRMYLSIMSIFSSAYPESLSLTQQFVEASTFGI